MRASTLLLAVLALVSFAAQSQPVKTWRLGMLTVNPRDANITNPIYVAFFQELRSLGYREGENLLVEWRHTHAQSERRRQESKALMAWKPDVVFTVSGTHAIALRDASATVPIVAGIAGDLVGMRLAATLARPGGNVTGQQLLSPDLAVKRMQLLRELIPRVQHVALLHAIAEEDQGFYDRIHADLQAAASSVGLTLRRYSVRTAADIDKAFGEMASAKVSAVLVVASPTITANRAQVIATAARRRIASMHEITDEAKDGGLISYGPKLEEMFRRGAQYVDRVLKGARPADMPIEQPTQFELAVNRKTASALGIKIPQSILVRADRVID